MTKVKKHKKVLSNLNKARLNVNIFLLGLAFILAFVIIFSGQNDKSVSEAV
ncbi:hypothetical protein IPM62_04985 [Candidatus Woesebacteria bacterium]|nr:MAG: hypothetical protein IPM62_04985 [Candidatus Woesebacteria bacterium]